ncbi:MAG TPA: branched-chain amino acid ABC transporter permease, partial [Actinomycetota bacterium]|nr:branched-chain amino acid ABC transporter permease [Actinomycetota bacterium]
FDSEAAGLVGMNTAWVYSLTFGIGAFMAGVTGPMIALTQSFTPVVGAAYTMKSFVIVVLGGLGSIPGAIVGGMILGVAENLTSIILNPGLRDAVSFILLVVILVLRPRGIFGKRFYAEV